jgi:hypothetical protein
MAINFLKKVFAKKVTKILLRSFVNTLIDSKSDCEMITKSFLKFET